MQMISVSCVMLLSIVRLLPTDEPVPTQVCGGAGAGCGPHLLIRNRQQVRLCVYCMNAATAIPEPSRDIAHNTA